MIFQDNANKPHQARGLHPDDQDSKRSDRATKYWQELFDTFGPQPRLHCFPLECQWPRAETTITVDDGLQERALQFCRSHNVPLHDLIYGAWGIVSARHTTDGQGKTAFTIRNPIQPHSIRYANKKLEDHEFPMILMVPEDQEISVLSWIRHVGTIGTEASSHAHIGYQQILRSTSAFHPQVKVSLINEDYDQNFMTEDADFPLVLNISLFGKLRVNMRHNLAVPRSDVRILLEHFVDTLNQVIDHHDFMVSKLPGISSIESQLLQEYGKAAVRPKNGLVHQLIEGRARSTPYGDAVQFETDTPITYSELNKLSNQLARQIRQYEASLVPVHMHISVHFIVTLLAILKAGAGYVILDPDGGVERRSYIVKDIQASFVLVDENTAGEFDQELRVADLLEQSIRHDDSELLTGQDDSDIAYIIYTSGSSGRPKAVELDHRAATNGLEAFPSIPELRQLLFYNPVFSAAQRSIWATLSVGGCLCLASRENLTMNIAMIINSMRISSIDMTSTTAALISPDKVPTLRRLVLGGEMVNSTIMQKWAHRVELYSSYGLSECTQLNWRHRLLSGTNPRMIGQPFDTTSSYILAPGTTDLSPLLVPGELCLGGSQLARGYLNLPKETQQRFIHNPFGQGKLYRTGDLAVRHADGSIELIGRIDLQVKINGQRVNPGEPNSVIEEHKDVEQSAVVPLLFNKKMLLVAIIVNRQDSDWSLLVKSIRSFLRPRLPLYMIPNFWVSAPKLPLNGNGKVDMAAVLRLVEELRDNHQLLPDRASNWANETDLNGIESILRGLWAEFLSLPESYISPDDSFLSLGGTSLEAIQVVSKLRSEHSLAVQVEDFFLGKPLTQLASLAQQSLENTIGYNHTAPFALLREPLSLQNLEIGHFEVEDAFPVTPFQEATISDTFMGGTSYIYSRSYNFTGHSQAAVKDALVTLMRTEPFLRTTFVAKGSTFLQIIKRSADIPWETPNMSAKDYIKQKASISMHAGGPWWSAAALPGDILVLTLHHALFDYWSNEFFIQDLESILLGRTPTPRPQFSRYVEYLQQYDETTMKTFWSNYLEGARPSKIGPYTNFETTVTAKLGFDVKAVASKFEVTPSVLLYAAWSMILAMTGSTDDVVFGVTLSGREAPVPGILDMSGPALVVAPIRIKVDKTKSFEAHLRIVQASLWEVIKHARYGLRKILKASRQPKTLFDSTVNFLIKVPAPKLERCLKALPETNLGTVENVKLELNNDNLEHVVLTSPLEEEFAQHIVETVAMILRTSSSTPLTEIVDWKLVRKASVPLKNGVEVKGIDPHSEPVTGDPIQTRQNQFDTSSAAPMAEHELAHAAFQRMAASHPALIAVQDVAGNRVTYAELSIKINRLAGLLRKKGVALEQIIPMMLEKSINTVVATFSILVAGAAFLPLGPENPRERNLSILEDLEGKIVIADRLNAGFFADTGYEVIVIDDLLWDEMPIQREIVPNLKPDNLAYVIYTSGSTGKPKGTLLTHGGLSAASYAINEATQTNISHRFLWALNYTFDGSLDTLFTALSTGCTLCVAPQSLIVSDMAGLVNQMDVNRINMTPSMTTLIRPDEVPTLRILITGGEAITSNILATWVPRVTVYNTYGPTEATISITTRPVSLGMNLRNIGRPFRSVTAQVLDPETMEPVPSSSIGELCLSGPQVARGYLKRPDATAKLFHDGPNGRIYQTGDLARILPNGEIELFGRKDDQVKINGYRIELGEIESVIAKAHVFERCVVITATVLRKKQLVAFFTRFADTTEERESAVILPPGHVIDCDQFKNQFSTIPNYMIPTIWLPVSHLPFSAAGKVDRKRLQFLVEGMTDTLLKEYLPKEETSEISSQTEEILQSLWSSLFEIPVDEVHANSSFHALGGDSISALNLISMLRRLGYDLKVNDILSRSNLRQQAIFMDEVKQLDHTLQIVSEKQVDYKPPENVYKCLSQLGVLQDEVEDIYPCSPGQVEFLTQGDKEEQFWQLMAVRELPEHLEFDRWLELTTKLTQKNQILRTLYLYTEKCNPQTAVQVVLRGSTLNLRYQLYETEEEKQQILENEWETRFDPAKPYVRYTLLVNSKDGTRHIVVKLDHASYDGTLLHIFDDQFKALSQNLPIRKHTPFKNFIGHVLSVPKQPQLDYWTSLLKNKEFNYPSKIVNPILSNLEAAHISVSVGIDGLASSSGVTAPIVFQTAYSLLLAHLSGTTDVIYDNLITGRNVPLDNPQLIDGNCANFLPFHSHITREKSVESLLKETQTAFWAATENGLVSLGEIYDALCWERSTSAAKCLFCFQPFEAVPAEQDSMRWIVMKMSKNRMHFNYAIQLEVVKALNKGEYIVRLGYDERAFTRQNAQTALGWYVETLRGMASGKFIKELNI